MWFHNTCWICICCPYLFCCTYNVRIMYTMLILAPFTGRQFDSCYKICTDYKLWVRDLRSGERSICYNCQLMFDLVCICRFWALMPLLQEKCITSVPGNSTWREGFQLLQFTMCHQVPGTSDAFKACVISEISVEPWVEELKLVNASLNVNNLDV